MTQLKVFILPELTTKTVFYFGRGGVGVGGGGGGLLSSCLTLSVPPDCQHTIGSCWEIYFALIAPQLLLPSSALQKK